MTSTTTRTNSLTAASLRAWSIEDAVDLYQIRYWSQGYFDVNEQGHVVVRPDTTRDKEIDLHDVVLGLRERNLNAPVLIRLTDILAHRLKTMHEAFAGAIRENDYKGRYHAIYPIKVNQQRQVVEEVYRHGAAYGFGLEVGSKPEILAVMGLTSAEWDDSRLIICNGFKDSIYLEAVVLAMKLGRRIVPVIENLTELDLLLRHAKRHGVRPELGVRVKLASQGAGRWRESAGAKSKFGLTATEVMALLTRLKAEEMEDCLKLVHCHVGSQIQDIRRLKEAIGELTHFYVELMRLGAGLEFIDVGGGLGVDYDGSQTNFDCSMNYSLQEYANEVVYRISSICNENEMPHPTILSESGRAIAAYHSVLVFNAISSTGFSTVVDESIRRPSDEQEEEMPQPVRDLYDAYDSVNERRLVECYHDILQAREQAMNLFSLGFLSLELRGLAERLYWATCAKIVAICRKLKSIPEEVEDLEHQLSDLYFCNFSVFQSLPDCWAIDQMFPMMPIHRLDEQPTRRAILADLTCDSDGKIDRFADLRETKRALNVHPLRRGEEYYLAAFLVGAYQETLGDLHNLFGDTHVVHVHVDETGQWCLDEAVRGDTAGKVLSYVQYDVDRLYRDLSKDCERAIRQGRITLSESRSLLKFYEGELSHYTYLYGETPDDGVPDLPSDPSSSATTSGS